MVRRWWLPVLVLAGCAVAGCTEEAREPAEPRPPVWVEPECPSAAPTQSPASTQSSTPALSAELGRERGGIPDDFEPAWVLRCREEERDLPEAGTWLVTERTDGPVTELLDLLRRPSDPLANKQCPAIAIEPPYFLLVDADGRALLPHVPTDGCGVPRAAVGDLLDTLPFRAVAETRLGP